MPSVDVVSTVDMQVLDNAVNNTKREVSTRFDFKNVTSDITLDRKEKVIHIQTGDELKVKSINEMLMRQCIRLKMDPKFLEVGKVEPTSQGEVKLDIKIKEGIPTETCKKIVKLIKDGKFKVQPTIQDNQVRVEGKKIDDLQAIMQLLRDQNYEIPLQFVNMRS
jgi:uncharacterized protein YajQ (UPF0234 family)